MITKEILCDLYEYKNGHLYYKKIITKNTKKIGDKVGSINKEGYVVTKIKNKSYLVHRLIYLMNHNNLPNQIDHIDGNPANNNIENLREANGSQNCMNKSLNRTNTSGYKNITWHKLLKKWRVQIKNNNTTKIFGNFEDLELAILVAEEARNKYAGEFARHN